MLFSTTQPHHTNLQIFYLYSIFETLIASLLDAAGFSCLFEFVWVSFSCSSFLSQSEDLLPLGVNVFVYL